MAITIWAKVIFSENLTQEETEAVKAEILAVCRMCDFSTAKIAGNVARFGAWFEMGGGRPMPSGDAREIGEILRKNGFDAVWIKNPF